MRTQAEITEGSPLGKFLTEQAERAAVVVEVGTGCGLGSTKCIYEGLRNLKHRSTPKFITIESDYNKYLLARENMEKYCGYIPTYGVLHRTIRPFYHPANRKEDHEMWEFERSIYHVKYCKPPVILESMPSAIDLLFLDGGEFTSDGDFLALWERSKVIVVDDCNARVATKNVYAARYLSGSPDWRTISPNGSQDDRNGWMAFERIQNG